MTHTPTIIKRTVFIAELAVREDLSQAKANQVVNTALKLIEDALSQGDIIRFQDFGRFEPRYHAGRSLKNMQTGETIDVPGRMVPIFIPSKRLKAKVRDDGGRW